MRRLRSFERNGKEGTSRLRTGPFARIFRLLGFRWRFVWTLPIPYHPLIAWALPFVPVALAGWAIARLLGGGQPPVDWWVLSSAGLLLIVPLSVPILNWVAFVFRVPLLQGFCFLSSMVLLGAEVLVGRQPPWLGALPALYFSIFLVQRIGGPRLLSKLQADNAAFVPLSAGDRLVRYRRSGSRKARLQRGQRLFEQFGFAMLAILPMWRSRGPLLFRPGKEAELLLRSLLREGEWQASKGGLRFDRIRAPKLPDRVTVKVRDGRSWLLAGPSTTVTIKDADGRRRLSAGRPSVVGNWPLLVLAYDFAIFNPAGKPGLYVGFATGRSVDLGDRKAPDLVNAAFVAQTPSAEASAQAMEAILTPILPAIVRRRGRRAAAHAWRVRRAGAALRRWLTKGGKSSPFRHWRLLLDHPAQISGHGARLCDKLAAAKDAANQKAAEAAAALLAALPLNEYVTLEDELIPLLGSRILALQWLLTSDLDVSKLPRDCPRWGPIAGFGLMAKVPELWARLGELGPRAAMITERFIEEVGERPALVQARTRFAQRSGEPFSGGAYHSVD